MVEYPFKVFLSNNQEKKKNSGCIKQQLKDQAESLVSTEVD